MVSFRREDCIDAEVNASGLMKQMQKDLLKELNITIDDENEEDSETETYEDCINNAKDLEDQINNLQLESEISKKEESAVLTHNVAINNEHFEELSTKISTEKQNNSENKCKQTNEDIAIDNIVVDEECSKHALYDLSSNAEDAFDDASVSYINNYDDTQSIRSVSTAATIAPEVIKKRVKLALDNREKKNQSKRILVKGEASAVTRTRRENRATIKDSLTGIWGME